MGRLALSLVFIITLSSCEPIVLKSELAKDVNSYLASQLGTVETPTFSPEEGTFSSDQSVSILDSTPNVIIHYTTDGSDPTLSSPTYTSPILVTGTGSPTVLKAIASQVGMQPSVIAKSTYTINYDQVAPPTFSPAPGSYSSDQLISLSSNTPGVSFRYTLDGSDPSSVGAGLAYVSPFLLPANSASTIKVIAFKDGLRDSSVTSGNFVSSPAGSVDFSFGGVGTGFNVITGLHGTQQKGIGVLSSGEIVFSGTAVEVSTQDLWVSKISAEGVESASAGTLLNTTNLSNYVSNFYQDTIANGGLNSLPGTLLVTPNDQVVVGGWVPSGGSWSGGVAVVLVDSAMNPLHTVSLGSAWPGAQQLAALERLEDGTFVAAGTDGFKTFVSHLLADLTLDSSYGNSGTLTINGMTPTSAFALSSGRVKVVGEAPGFNAGYVVTAQVTSGGALDSAYGGGTGKVSNLLPQYGVGKNGVASVDAAAIQPDGRIVFAGNPLGVANSDRPWVVGRLNFDGSLDPSFGNPVLGGLLLLQVPQAYAPPNYASQYDVVGGLSITNAGAILVVGSSRFLDASGTILGVQNTIARFTPSGRLDLGFNMGTPYGGLILSHGNFNYTLSALTFVDGWNSVITQQTGRTVVGGTATFSLKLSRFW